MLQRFSGPSHYKYVLLLLLLLLLVEDTDCKRMNTPLTHRDATLPAGEKVLLLLSGVACEEKKEKIASCLFHMKRRKLFTCMKLHHSNETSSFK